MSKSVTESTSKPLAGTLEGTEKGREGGGSDLREVQKSDHMAHVEILKRYYGVWLGGMWARSGEDVYDLGAGG